MKRLMLVLLVACSSADEPARESAPESEPETPVPPEGLLLTIDFGAGALQKLAEAVESPMLRASVPASPRELVMGVDERPRRVDARGPVRVLLMGRWDAPQLAIGFGSNGRRQVVATDRDLLHEAGGWASAPVETEAIRARFEDDAMEGLRRTLDGLLDEQVQTARAGIEREESRHDEPPTLGDPRALVQWVAQRVASYVAFVPDLRDAHVSVDFDPLVVRGAWQAAEGSPVAAALEDERIEPMPNIPGGSALAWWRAAPRPGWTELLQVSAGSRLSDEDRAIIRELGERRADRTLVAVGHDQTPFALIQAPDAAPALEPMLGVDHVRTLLGLFRCERVGRVAVGSRLCADGPFVNLSAADDAYTLSVADRADFEPSPTRADVSRVLPRLASGIVVLDAGRIAPASGLWRRVAPAAPTRDTPLALSWSAQDGSLAFELRFSPGSLAALSDATMAATDP